MGLHNYNDTHKHLPPGFWSGSGWGWAPATFAFMEAGPDRWSKWDASLGDRTHNVQRADWIRIPLESYLCPSDQLRLERASAIEPVLITNRKGAVIRDLSQHLRVHLKTAIRTSQNGSRYGIAPFNYIAIFGDEDLMCSAAGTGMFWPNSGVSLKDDVSDGTSTTLMLGERDGSIHLAGNWAGTSYDENDPDACLDPQFVVDALVDSRPINGRDERCFSSRHPGGAHFLMADGAVKFVNEKCSTTILRRLANRADGMKVNEADIP